MVQESPGAARSLDENSPPPLPSRRIATPRRQDYCPVISLYLCLLVRSEVLKVDPKSFPLLRLPWARKPRCGSFVWFWRIRRNRDVWTKWSKAWIFLFFYVSNWLRIFKKKGPRQKCPRALKENVDKTHIKKPSKRSLKRDSAALKDPTN